MITDKMVDMALTTWIKNRGLYPDAMRAALEAVAPQLIAAYLRKAATEMGDDSRLEKLFLSRAQELDPR